MSAPPKTVVQKRRGRPRTGTDPVISFRLDHDLEWELHDWRYLPQALVPVVPEVCLSEEPEGLLAFGLETIKQLARMFKFDEFEAALDAFLAARFH
jgi:hypothetical protein